LYIPYLQLSRFLAQRRYGVVYSISSIKPVLGAEKIHCGVHEIRT